MSEQQQWWFSIRTLGAAMVSIHSILPELRAFIGELQAKRCRIPRLPYSGCDVDGDQTRPTCLCKSKKKCIGLAAGYKLEAASAAACSSSVSKDRDRL